MAAIGTRRSRGSGSNSGLSSVGSEGGSHGSSRRCPTRHQTAACGDRECPVLVLLREDHPLKQSNLEKTCPSGSTTKGLFNQGGGTFLCTSPGENSPWCCDP